MGVLEYSLGSFQLAVFVIHLSVKQHLLVSGKKKNRINAYYNSAFQYFQD